MFDSPFQHFIHHAAVDAVVVALDIDLVETAVALSTVDTIESALAGRVAADMEGNQVVAAALGIAVAVRELDTAGTVGLAVGHQELRTVGTIGLEAGVVGRHTAGTADSDPQELGTVDLAVGHQELRTVGTIGLEAGVVGRHTAGTADFDPQELRTVDTIGLEAGVVGRRTAGTADSDPQELGIVGSVVVAQVHIAAEEADSQVLSNLALGLELGFGQGSCFHSNNPRAEMSVSATNIHQAEKLAYDAERRHRLLEQGRPGGIGHKVAALSAWDMRKKHLTADWHSRLHTTSGSTDTLAS
ncbi:hypothetical protein PC119_g4292 [Phytophthora cactorum]|uniref:Uncharacterized protein n=1 Tax=Phytophthora cactorum TaxID=29920 RepID=A0A8T1EDR4_9STRA|nr:hypothetical protein PC114_g5588 [Phytophthora cactorum]KAG2949759.1 hypothetical protein PC117_g4994 [Phytophthora cactorum]KAG3036253.1 hypothetical protein PC119_g4292 [Phytophthora cactorum]KAG3097646.1 hypothetical protein PC122_g4401 [Phytophthora cactorum]